MSSTASRGTPVLSVIVPRGVSGIFDKKIEFLESNVPGISTYRNSIEYIDDY
jgi:hypothetical protein